MGQRAGASRGRRQTPFATRFRGNGRRADASVFVSPVGTQFPAASIGRGFPPSSRRFHTHRIPRPRETNVPRELTDPATYSETAILSAIFDHLADPRFSPRFLQGLVLLVGGVTPGVSDFAREKLAQLVVTEKRPQIHPSRICGSFGQGTKKTTENCFPRCARFWSAARREPNRSYGEGVTGDGGSVRVVSSSGHVRGGNQRGF